MHNKPIIHIQSSNDAGVEWSESDHGRYCQEVEKAIALVYPGYAITCEPADINRTKVEVSNPALKFVNEEIIAEECERICDDVWEQGNFWD